MSKKFVFSEENILTTDSENLEQEVKNGKKDDESEHSHHHRHHHHHHHHHHHNSSSSQKKNGKNKKIARFLKKNRKKIFNVFLVILFVCILAVIGAIKDLSITKHEDNNAKLSSVKFSTDDSLTIKLPYFNEEVLLVQKIVQDYYKSDDVDAIQNIYKNHRQSGRLDVGLSVDLSFEIQSMPEGESFKNATVELSKHSNFKDSEVYNLNQKLGIKIYHLETDTKYYYKLTLTFTNGSTTSNTGSFKTAEGPRLLNIDGIANVRDIGGYSVISGAKIKQGLLFRGSELDGAVNPKYSITGIGISDFLTKLDIKTCMDLRYKADLTGITNPLGDKVNTKSYDAYMYTEIFSASGKNVIKKIFTDLANKNNYPIYMHCTHGLDRTGTVVYLLDALLGMSETDMMKEYKLSVLYHGWSNDEEMNAFIVRLKRYEGATLQEKAANFLISAGVTQKQIDNIRDIFLTF